MERIKDGLFGAGLAVVATYLAAHNSFYDLKVCFLNCQTVKTSAPTLIALLCRRVTLRRIFAKRSVQNLM